MLSSFNTLSVLKLYVMCSCVNVTVLTVNVTVLTVLTVLKQLAVWFASFS